MRGSRYIQTRPLLVCQQTYYISLSLYPPSTMLHLRLQIETVPARRNDSNIISPAVGYLTIFWHCRFRYIFPFKRSRLFIFCGPSRVSVYLSRTRDDRLWRVRVQKLSVERKAPQAPKRGLSNVTFGVTKGCCDRCNATAFVFVKRESKTGDRAVWVKNWGKGWGKTWVRTGIRWGAGGSGWER